MQDAQGQDLLGFLHKLGRGEKHLLLALLFMFSVGVLQAFLTGSQFSESCGYPFNASYIVFFMLCQINVIAIFLRSLARNLILEDLWNIPPIRSSLLLLLGLPGFQFPSNLVASIDLSSKCGGLEIPFFAQVVKYLACGLSGLVMLALILFGLVYMFSSNMQMDDEDWWIMQTKKKLPSEILQSLWRHRGTKEGCYILANQAVGQYIPNDEFLEDEICRYYIKDILSKQITNHHKLWLQAQCRVCRQQYTVSEEVILFPKKVTKDSYFKHMHTDCMLRLCTSQLTEISSTITFLSNLHESINSPLPRNPPELIVPSEPCPYKTAQ